MENLQQLQTSYEKYVSSDTEIEVRFGNFNSRGAFTPGVSKAQFMNVLDYFMSRKKHFSYECHSQKILYFNNGKRTVIVLDTKSDKASVSYHKKNIDTINVNDYGFRMSVSSETALKSNPTGEPQKQVIRTRHSYTVDGYFRFDISESKDEYSIELESLGATFDVFIKNVFLVIKIIQETRIIMSRTEQKQVLSYYNKISKSNKFIGVQPASISNKVYRKNEDYAMTLKLDGLRNLCICFNDNLYLISTSMKVLKLGFLSKKHKDFILDGEYFKGDYHVFDIIDDAPLADRLKRVSDIVKSLQPHQVRLGEVYVKHYDFDDVYSKFLEAKSSLNSKVHDGIIFVKTNTDYRNSAPLKWKSPDKITIDLQVVGKSLMAQGRDSLEKFGEMSHYYPGIVDNDIVEWAYDTTKSEFVPVKHRRDKTKPNFIIVAKDNMSCIITPFDESLLDKNPPPTPLKNMRKFHNWVKRTYIEKYKQSAGTVIDFGCGRGGDFGKYIDSGFACIYGIDCNQKNLDEATRRSADMLLNPENENISIKISQYDLTKDVVSINDKADLAVCNFAFHFFSKTLDVFISNVINNTKKGAYIVLTFMDPELIEFTETDEWSITKVSENAKVCIKGSMLEENQVEPIVDIQETISKFKEYGIELVEQTCFKNLYSSWKSKAKTLSDSEKRLSFMNTAMVFQLSA
jgi:ubiquinone/menaquinone biosynthesis C-methylase UbiE